VKLSQNTRLAGVLACFLAIFALAEYEPKNIVDTYHGIAGGFTAAVFTWLVVSLMDL